MAGTIPLSMTQQLDSAPPFAPLAGGRLYIIQAGTTSTPQNAFQDSALTLPLPNPIILDAAGRLPQFFLADGSIKVRLTDVNGVEKLVADGLIVTGASSGGGGGSPVDPTTVLQTGWLQHIYGTGVVSGFVRCNGRTIGSATSGATERANADTSALYSFLWNGDPNLAVSTGRGASSAADFAANKTIALPDLRGRTLSGLDDMGGTAASRLTSTYFGAGTTLGAAGGGEKNTIAQANLPNVAFTVTGTASVTSTTAGTVVGTVIQFNNGGGVVERCLDASNGGNAAIASSGSISGTAASGGSGTPLTIVQPTMVVTIYVKL